MKEHFQLAILILAASVLSVNQAAVAQSSNPRLYRSGNEWIQEVSGNFTAGKYVKVRSSSGSIRIQGAQQSNITYTIREHVRAATEERARYELSRMKFTTYSSGETVVLRADCEGSNRGSIDFEIQVPAQTSLVKLETAGGSVTATALSGRVEANTAGGGSIHLDQISGIVVASSGGGNIEIGKVGSDVQATTGGGNIHLVSAAGTVNATSGGGNLNIGWAKLMTLRTEGGSIYVTKCDGQVRAETGGGNIELKDIAGAATIETGGGSIHFGPIKGGVRAETAAGAIIARLAAGGSFTDSRLETSLGDIIVYVPEGMGMNVRAAVEAARGYGIRSEFGELKISNPQNLGPREFYAEGSLNGGGPVLHVHAAAGNIEFKREARR
ncbi:MAG TPA: hypothetical protein VE133_14830 [Candidatus Sulfotelmatobacter sp.]|nr:hypothetical protein [Candidatus Sulfotelmatobacter sp.]